MKFVFAIIAAFALAVPAWAEDYEKGPNGGLQLDVAGIDAELLTSGKTVTINVFDPKNAKPVSTKGYSASVLIVSGANREPLTLVQSGENSLKGEAKSSFGTDATITLNIKTEAGKSGQVRFKVGDVAGTAVKPGAK